jgi:hypothetical protein
VRFQPLFFFREFIRVLSRNRYKLSTHALINLTSPLLQNILNIAQSFTVGNAGWSAFFKGQFGEVGHNIMPAFACASVVTKTKYIILSLIRLKYNFVCEHKVRLVSGPVINVNNRPIELDLRYGHFPGRANRLRRKVRFG